MALAIETLEQEAYRLYIQVLDLKEEDFTFDADAWERVVQTVKTLIPQNHSVNWHFDSVAQKLARAYGIAAPDKKTLAAFNVVARHLGWLSVSSGSSDALEMGRKARVEKWPGIFTKLMERN